MENLVTNGRNTNAYAARHAAPAVRPLGYWCLLDPYSAVFVGTQSQLLPSSRVVWIIIGMIHRLRQNRMARRPGPGLACLCPAI
jgi:hypothetical protein